MRNNNIEGGDEIGRELRRLQNDLRRLVELNNMRKRVVLNVALERLAYQECQNVVDELDKQIEQTFLKRSVCSSQQIN